MIIIVVAYCAAAPPHRDWLPRIKNVVIIFIATRNCVVLIMFVSVKCIACRRDRLLHLLLRYVSRTLSESHTNEWNYFTTAFRVFFCFCFFFLFSVRTELSGLVGQHRKYSSAGRTLFFLHVYEMTVEVVAVLGEFEKKSACEPSEFAERGGDCDRFPPRRARTSRFPNTCLRRPVNWFRGSSDVRVDSLVAVYSVIQIRK